MAAVGAAAVGGVALVTLELGQLSKSAAHRVKAGPTKIANAPAQKPPSAARPGPTTRPPLVLITRKEWGAADPDVSPEGQGEHGPYQAVTNPDGWLVYEQPLAEVLNTIIVHHSALPLTDGPLAIQKLHMEEKGFADIGYQFLIDETGKLYEGRAMNVRGAHTFGANYASVGICLIGNFEEIQPTPVQLDVLKATLAALIQQYPLITRLAGHRDFNPTLTLCPGANLYPLLPGLAQAQGLRYGV